MVPRKRNFPTLRKSQTEYQILRPNPVLAQVVVASQTITFLSQNTGLPDVTTYYTFDKVITVDQTRDSDPVGSLSVDLLQTRISCHSWNKFPLDVRTLYRQKDAVHRQCLLRWTTALLNSVKVTSYNFAPDAMKRDSYVSRAHQCSGKESDSVTESWQQQWSKRNKDGIT
ncbi:hypothetical protein BaRGS_00026691 [Batillaria attramentaria]|uniref:Uncharacterized protein n=1 Tax=Batillaria attramentaria TaxID=370345 RepID=A0ABD0K3U3_9CAEN